MEMESVKNLPLGLDGITYTGWGYYKNHTFVPNGNGKKYYSDHYEYGNFQDGVLNGPAIISYDYYMFTKNFVDGENKGWGLCINRGELREFGYYENNELCVDLTHLVEWYFDILDNSGRTNENMLTKYTHKETKAVTEIFIGYAGGENVFGTIGHMGFRFESDGSIWMGNTLKREKTGSLIHFRNDGVIECGYFHESELIYNLKLHELMDIYFGTSEQINDNDFQANSFLVENLLNGRDNKLMRKKYEDLAEIKQGYDYRLLTLDDSPLKKEYNMVYHVQEVAIGEGERFTSLNKEDWVCGMNSIQSPYGFVTFSEFSLITDGPLIGVEFNTFGRFTINNKDYYIGKFALLRQPQNAWLWAYLFDFENNNVLTFCGFDDLNNGLDEYIHQLKIQYLIVEKKSEC